VCSCISDSLLQIHAHVRTSREHQPSHQCIFFYHLQRLVVSILLVKSECSVLFGLTCISLHTSCSWVFLDGVWVSCMSFTLPLAKAAKNLSKLRPTASVLGPNTMWSFCGTLAINFVFLVIALTALFAQDWFQCRKWGSNDVSNVNTIGDNYETSVIFIVSGYQYISSAAAFNFGYSFRQNWFRNYFFVLLFLLFTGMQFGMTLSAGYFSCIWRVNCDNNHAVRTVTSFSSPPAISNIYSTTVMPVAFRWLLVGLMVANLVIICVWNFFIVNTVRMGRKGAENAREDVPSAEV
jgi:magnesium-transporting ATPase (P-type)